MSQDYSFSLEKDHAYTRAVEASPEVKEVLLLSRYARPTEDQVVDRMVEAADSVMVRFSLLIPGREGQVSLSPLEGVLASLHPKIRQGLVQRKEECLAFARNNTPVGNREIGAPVPYFVQAEIGYLPVDFTLLVGRDAQDFYRNGLHAPNLLKQGAGLRGSFTVAIGAEPFSLPDPSDMAVLLKHYVRDSAVFTVQGLPSQSSLDAGLELIYSLKDSADHGFSSLPDISAGILDTYCFRCATEFYPLSEKLKEREKGLEPRSSR